MLETFHSRRDEVIAALRDLHGSAEAIGAKSLAARIDAALRWRERVWTQWYKRPSGVGRGTGSARGLCVNTAEGPACDRVGQK